MFRLYAHDGVDGVEGVDFGKDEFGGFAVLCCYIRMLCEGLFYDVGGGVVFLWVEEECFCFGGINDGSGCFDDVEFVLDGDDDEGGDVDAKHDVEDAEGLLEGVASVDIETMKH